VTPGEHIILADEPADFAAAVTDLLDAPDRRARLGTASQLLVNERYGTEPIARQFESICLQTLRRAGAGNGGRSGHDATASDASRDGRDNACAWERRAAWPRATAVSRK